MGSLASVRDAAARIVATESRLDVVVDNAGAIFPERTEGPDGIEATLAVLVVGPFALVAGLLPLLRRTPGSRVIAITSGGMYTQRLDLDDLQWRAGGYAGAVAYARGEAAQTALVREWARRLGGPSARRGGGPGRPGGPTGLACPSWRCIQGGPTPPGLAESLPTFHRVMRPLLRTPA